MNLADRCVLVTGANRGLGREIAAHLVRAGAHVVLAARNEQLLSEAAADMVAERPNSSQKVLVCPADVAKADQVHDLVTFSERELGRIDVLVCNAGVYGPIGRVEENDWAEWQRAMEINVYGAVLCCREVVPLMRRQGYGKIIGLSGGGATKPLPRFSAYSASKAAVVRFLETLAVELAGSGIDVNAIAPGALNTRLLDQVLEAGPLAAGEEFYKGAQAQAESGGTPLSTPAELVTFLASNESDGITGRLIAAVWDDWQRFPEIRDKLAGSDVYTLRRIVPSDRGWD